MDCVGDISIFFACAHWSINHMKKTKIDYLFDGLAFFALPYFVAFDFFYSVFKKHEFKLIVTCSDMMFFLAIVSAVCQALLVISIIHLF